MYLLAADSKLHNFIQRLPSKHIGGMDKSTARKSLLGLQWVIRRLSEVHGFQLVIIDMGPGSDALTMMMLSAADVVLPPFQADHYSYAVFAQLLKEGGVHQISRLIRRSASTVSRGALLQGFEIKRDGQTG